jgi:hypothetical protein
MKVALIAPIELLRYSERFSSGYYMVLPQLLGDEDYFKFYARIRGHKILDNGEAEGVQVHPDKLFQAADVILADEIVVPDVMGDCYATIDRAKAFEHYARENPQYDYIGVAQGKTLNEVRKCLTFLSLQDWVSVLALPRILVNAIGNTARTYIINRYHRTIMDGFTAVHCLGMGHHLEEVQYLADLPVRGIDTSLPYSMTLANTTLQAGSTYQPRQKDYFDTTLVEDGWPLLNANLTTFMEWADDKPVDRSGVQDI